MNEMTLIGKKKFKSKAGAICCQLFFARPLSDFDKQYALDVEGSMVETVWVSETIYDSLDSKCIGKDCVVVSSYINGRSSIFEVRVANK